MSANIDDFPQSPCESGALTVAQCRVAIRRLGRLSRLFTGLRVNEIIETGNALVMEAKGLGRAR
jgi:hypothetical protein